MPKYVMALSATLFLSILLVSLIVLGDTHVRVTAFVALFFAALSQFVAQDAPLHRNIYIASIVLAYLAVGFSFAAIVAFA